MSLSLIKELWSKIQKQEINTNNSTIPLNEDLDKNNIINNEKDNILKINKFNNSLIAEDYKFIHDFFTQKFPDVRDIFSKFNSEDYYSFIENSNFKE